VDFPTAVKTVYTQKYADFSGRARRSEFWFGWLADFIAGLVVGVIDALIGNKILAFVLALAALVPFFSSAARRLHDTGRSGWWLLLYLTIIGGFVILYWLILDGDENANEYGPSPKGGSGYGPQGGYGQPAGYGQAPGYGQNPATDPNYNADPNWGQPPA
jgi:uncharacterized membrane protein YhaH (DUF805 family)